MRFTTVIRTILAEERRIKIAILGPDNAGKTTLLSTYLKIPSENIPPTFGHQTFSKRIFYQDKEYSVDFLDIGGQQCIREYWDTYYTGVDGVIFVFDISEPTNYQTNLEQTLSHPALRNTPFVFAGNKADNQNSIISNTTSNLPNDYIEILRESSGARSNHKIPLFYTSSKHGYNLNELFFYILGAVVESKYEYSLL
ncbi:ADP-ribosylation factor-like protein 2 [Nematocida sp. AWRm80]|nr:ADP-ribosylation factor-like protein 2 [Nematocida sp. AWRm80]